MSLKDLKNHWRATDRESFPRHRSLFREFAKGSILKTSECKTCESLLVALLTADDAMALAREWFTLALNRNSDVSMYYRIYAEEYDLEEDLLLCLDAFPAGTNNKSLESLFRYDLRLLFRFFMRRYAFRQALRVHKHLSALHEPLRWRLWRCKDILHLRLVLATIVGYVAVGTSEESWALIERLSQQVFSISCVCAFLFCCVLSAVDMQRYAGRILIAQIVFRSVMFTSVGFVFGLGGAFLHFQLARILGFCQTASAQCSWRFAVLSSVTAVVLGFVVHLLWQESSSADPL